MLIMIVMVINEEDEEGDAEDVIRISFIGQVYLYIGLQLQVN